MSNLNFNDIANLSDALKGAIILGTPDRWGSTPLPSAPAAVLKELAWQAACLRRPCCTVADRGGMLRELDGLADAIRTADEMGWCDESRSCVRWAAEAAATATHCSRLIPVSTVTPDAEAATACF